MLGKGCCVEQILSMERCSSPSDHLSYYRILSQENNPVPKGFSHENFLLHG